MSIMLIGLRRYFSINETVHIFALVSIVLIFVIELYLIDLPEITDNEKWRADLIVQLSLAYLASYIFYTVVVHVKLYKDKSIIGPFVASQTGSAAAPIRIIFNEMFNSARIPIEERKELDKLDENEIKDLVSKINPNHDAPYPYSRIYPSINTWWDFFNYWKNETERRIDTVMVHSQYLDSEHVFLLIKLRNIPLFSSLEMSLGRVENEDCSAFADSFIKWYRSSQALLKYCEAHYGEFCHRYDIHGDT